jgi:hypothetical protein
MGILDGYPFDPGSEGGAAPPGWLGLVLGAHARPPQAAGDAMPAPVAPGLAPGVVSGLAAALAPHLAPHPAPTLAPGSAAQAAPPRPRFLAPGVKRIDGRLTGEKYLAQFSPEVQAAVKAALAGSAVRDTGQRPGFAQAVAAIARKYAGAGASLADATPEPAAPAQPDAKE